MDFVFGEERVKNEDSLLFAIHLFSLESAIYMINGVCLRLCTLHSDCIKMFIVSLRCVCVCVFSVFLLRILCERSLLTVHSVVWRYAYALPSEVDHFSMVCG